MDGPVFKTTGSYKELKAHLGDMNRYAMQLEQENAKLGGFITRFRSESGKRQSWSVLHSNFEMMAAS